MTDLTALTTATETKLLVAFFDLTRFSRETRGRDTRELFVLMSDYYEFVGDIVENARGIVVKFIGDATLAVFGEENVDDGVLALKALMEQGDDWLQARDLKSRHIVKAHFGAVTCGPIGTRGEKHFDVFGEAVCTAATLQSNGLALTPQVFRKLAADTRKHFKKHTTPVTYIPKEEPHRN